VSGRLFFALLILLALGSTSFAQTLPAFEGSFGYSFLRNFNNFNRHGWVGSAMGNVNDWLGIKGEVGGPGGGIDYWFQPHLGLRLGADYRRAFRENRDLNYFRLQAGIVFRFGTR
jgi:hypothetical protein